MPWRGMDVNVKQEGISRRRHEEMDVDRAAAGWPVASLSQAQDLAAVHSCQSDRRASQI